MGRAAFTRFAWRGRMAHDLAEPIPGAPAWMAETDDAPSLARLQAAKLQAVLDRFRGWSPPLQPHVADGPLDRAAFEPAQAMHLAGHPSSFEVAG